MLMVKSLKIFAIAVLGLTLLYLAVCGVILNITIISGVMDESTYEKRKEALLKIDSLYKDNPSLNVDSLKNISNLPF